MRNPFRSVPRVLGFSPNVIGLAHALPLYQDLPGVAADAMLNI